MVIRREGAGNQTRGHRRRRHRRPFLPRGSARRASHCARPPDRADDRCPLWRCAKQRLCRPRTACPAGDRYRWARRAAGARERLPRFPQEHGRRVAFWRLSVPASSSALAAIRAWRRSWRRVCCVTDRPSSCRSKTPCLAGRTVFWRDGPMCWRLALRTRQKFQRARVLSSPAIRCAPRSPILPAGPTMSPVRCGIF